MTKLPKRIHIIGICGVATSAIAIAFKNKGCVVSGSDKGFYPPVSTELEKNQVPFYAGWHPEKMSGEGKPDLVMTGGGGTSPSNPEVIFAKENNIPVYTYPEILEKYFIKKNSVVAVGTWGKTTTSSLLSFILIQAGMDPSYFTGGLSLSHPTGTISDSDWSVVEGDEYQVSISDKRPKFVYYAPTHLLLTSVSWDHADLYPTEKAYFDEFRNLLKNVSARFGLIVACVDEKGVSEVTKDLVIKNEAMENIATGKFITYGKSPEVNYRYHDIIHTKNGLDFTIDYTNNTKSESEMGSKKSWKIHSPMLGRFNAENITGCFAMAEAIGIGPEKIIEAISDFKGIKRRFEKRLDGAVTILDCHAPTPEKAFSVLESIREVYKQKILAVYEPNIGGRQRASAAMYDGAFKNADMVIVPRLTKLKVANESLANSDEKDPNAPMEGDELTETISRTHDNVHFIESDQNLVEYLKSETHPGDVIVFLGSHGFRGMIEESVKKFE